MFLHIDGDSFFASCEVSLNPALKGRPVVTGQERGIVSAMTYEAKALGITRGMPIFKVRKEFPNVIVVSSDYYLYRIFSKRMFSIVRSHGIPAEEYSIDECFSDLSSVESEGGFSPLSLARAVKDDLESKLGMTFSVGVAPTKVLAKVASKSKKPSGLVVISSDMIEACLAGLPIEKVWGIGRETAFKLWRYGIKTALDFVSKDELWMKELFNRPQLEIWHELQGTKVFGAGGAHDSEPDSSAQKSISRTGTFKPKTSDRALLLSELSKHVECVCERARRIGAKGRNVSFFLKTDQFVSHRSEFKLPLPTDVPSDLMRCVRALFGQVYQPHRLYRATGVTLGDLSPARGGQGDLFSVSDGSDAFSRVYAAVDSITSRHGRDSIFLASSMSALPGRCAEKRAICDRVKIKEKRLDIPSMGEAS